MRGDSGASPCVHNGFTIPPSNIEGDFERRILTKGKGKRVHPLAYRAARKSTWGGVIPHALRHKKAKKTSENLDEVLGSQNTDLTEGEWSEKGVQSAQDQKGGGKTKWFHMMHRRRQKMKAKAKAKR